jgi:hypothetical protein
MLCIKAANRNFIAVLTFSSHHSGYFAVSKNLVVIKISLVKGRFVLQAGLFLVYMAFSSIS